MRWWSFVLGWAMFFRMLSGTIFVVLMIVGAYFLFFKSIVFGMMIIGAGIVGCWLFNFVVNILILWADDAMARHVELANREFD